MVVLVCKLTLLTVEKSTLYAVWGNNGLPKLSGQIPMRRRLDTDKNKAIYLSWMVWKVDLDELHLEFAFIFGFNSTVLRVKRRLIDC